MTHEWITDRLPIKADADAAGDVIVPWKLGDAPAEGFFQHYGLIVPGQPWWPYRAAQRVEVEPAPVPTPTRKVVQITPAESELYALCDDDTIWCLVDRTWIQLPAIPQPEA